MSARYLNIDAKHRQMRGFHASLADFREARISGYRWRTLCEHDSLELPLPLHVGEQNFAEIGRDGLTHWLRTDAPGS